MRSLVAVLLLLSLLLSLCHSQCPRGCFCASQYAVCYNTADLFEIPKFANTTTRLFISGNHFNFISEEPFRDLEELKDLSLPSNDIMFVSYSAFAQNSKMVFLNLDFNDISELQPYTFRNLNSLQNLSLNHNELRELQEETFHGLDSLVSLSLKNNHLRKVDVSVVTHLPSLQTLELSGNDMECDCTLAWMKDFPPLARSPVLCSSPPALAGRMLNNITYQELNCVPPSAQSQMAVVSGFKGEQGIELRCLVEGNPKPEVKWFFKGEKLTDSLHYRVAENGSLIMVVVLSQLAGDYVCLAQNLMGNNSATVHFEYAGVRVPVFLQAPSDTHAFVGSSFFLPCQADEVTDTYQWMKDGEVLASSSDFVIEPGVGLTVSGARKSHSGRYYCVAMSEERSANVSAVVNVTNAVITCDGVLSPSMVEGFRERVNLAFNLTRQELLVSSHSPGSLLKRLKFPDSGIIEHLKAAEVFDQALMMIRNQLLGNSTSVVLGVNDIPDLSMCELEVLSQLSGCEDHQREADCSSCFHQKYRSVDGTCNNFDNPLQGATEVPFLRLLEPAYEDRVGLPVGWSNSRPSARTISQKLISANEVTGNERFTLMLMQLGQFLDHDIDLAPVSPSDIAFDISDPNKLSNCRDICHNDAPCFPIPVPEDDPRIINHQCLPFTRSSAVCGSGASSLLVGTTTIHREQINVITSYIDGSMVYGSTDLSAQKLRDQSGRGKLLEGQLTESGKRLLPFDNESLIECSTGIHANRSQCFLGGDVRTNEQVGLTSMHTLFNREHNRIVGVLAGLNPHWEDEQLYQEARKVLVAEWQHIVFHEYLPKILGNSYLGEYKGYNASVDATIANGFATAAFRFGHSQIMPLFHRLDSNYEPLAVGPLRLQDAFFAPFRIIEEGGIDPLIRGLISTPVKLRLSSQGINNNLTEALFAQAHEVALDLAALNIQRGRDHGLPGYNRWRSYCNLTTPNSIEGLEEHISNATIRRKIQEVYGDNPDDIDLWVGGLLEDPLPGSQLGPTFLCIIGEQFRRLRDGDRFYYERQGQFTPDQLVQIKQASLSRVICDNADDIDLVPVDAFVLHNTSDFVACDELPRVDLMLWKECSECEDDGRRKRSALFRPEPNEFQNLLKKVSLLEEKVGICKFNGKFYEDGDSWSLSKCTTCSCQSGAVECNGNNPCL